MLSTPESHAKIFFRNIIFLIHFFMKLIFLLFFHFIDFLQFYKSGKFHDFQTSETRVSENDAASLGCFFDRFDHE